MNSRYQKIISLTWLLWVGAVYGQSDCKMKLLNIVKGYTDISGMNLSEMLQYEVKYSVVPSDSSSDSKTVSKDIKIILARKIMVVATNESSVYSDSLNTFTVIPTSKTILWKKNSLFEESVASMQSGLELFKHIDSYTCSAALVNGISYQKYLCIPNAQFVKDEDIIKVEYLINGDKLYRSRVYYSKGSGINYMEMIYTKFQKVPLPESYKYGVKRIFLDTKTNKPKAKYAGYYLDIIK